MKSRMLRKIVQTLAQDPVGLNTCLSLGDMAQRDLGSIYGVGQTFPRITRKPPSGIASPLDAGGQHNLGL